MCCNLNNDVLQMLSDKQIPPKPVFYNTGFKMYSELQNGINQTNQIQSTQHL